MPRPFHFEIHADDPERAMRFYSSVFKWKFERWAGVDPAYWLFSTGDDAAPGINGGLMRRRGPRPADMQPINGYVVIIAVDKLDARARAVMSAGGRQVVDTAAMPGVGWLGYFKDTEGNIFGMMQPDKLAS